MKISDLAHQLEPFIVQMIEEYVQHNTNTAIGGGGAFLPREHNIWLLDSGGAAIKDYSADSNGFQSANSDASSGDIIWVPACTIADDHTITAGAKVVGESRWATIFSGQLTLGADSCLENLSIERSKNDGSNYSGVVIGASGTAYISDCDIEVTNAGAGDAYGLNVNGNGNVECWSCYLHGNSGSGSGYAGYHGGGTGNAYIYGGRAYGTTGSFNV